MKPIQRNGANFFPNGVKNVWIILLDGYFQPLRSPNIYRITHKDFGPRQVKATNIENPADTITIDFITPVTHFKKF